MAESIGSNVGSIVGFSTSHSRWLDSANHDGELTGLISHLLRGTEGAGALSKPEVG